MSKELQKELLSVEIFKPLTELEEGVKTAETEIKSKVIAIDDLKEKYVLRINYIESENINLESITPEKVHPMDQFELNESIIEILNDLGFNAKPMISDEDMDKEINKEAIEQFRAIARKFSDQIKEAKEKKESGDESTTADEKTDNIS
jgi:predicted ATP-grasp superfamily ATP-dependent carboligase